MCKCPAGDRVKYATATFEGPALSWWNATAQNMGLGEAIAMPWADFVQLLRSEYCPREEVQKLEHEVWSYKMVGSEIEEYTVRHNKLAVLCPDLHTPEYRRIEHYVAGLVPEVRGLVAAGNLAVYSEVVRSAHRLTNMNVAEGVLPPRGTTVKAPVDHKRKWDGSGKSSGLGQPQQQVKRVEVLGSSSDQKQGGYTGKKPRCDLCGFHHYGNCDRFRCERCNKTGHFAKDCRASLPTKPTQATG